MPSISETERDSVAEAPKIFAWSLLLFGLLGWWASFSLTLDKLKVLSNPDVTLGCDISPFISCKSVMGSTQAALFGFPNPLIGVAAFVVPTVIGATLLAGATFRRWFWIGALIGHTLGFTFVIWLFTQAVYDIGALCPWCMVAWTGMIPIFWAMLGFTAKTGVLGHRLIRAGEAIYSWAWVLAALTYLGIAFAILIQFWDYWVTLL